MDKNPYSNCEINYCAYLAFFSCLLLFTTAIFGIIYSVKTKEKFDEINCITTSLSTNFIYGEENNNNDWIGITKAIDGLKRLSGDLKSKENLLKNSFMNTEWLDNDKKTLIAGIEDIYIKNKDKSVITPNLLTNIRITPEVIKVILNILL